MYSSRYSFSVLDRCQGFLHGRTALWWLGNLYSCTWKNSLIHQDSFPHLICPLAVPGNNFCTIIVYTKNCTVMHISLKEVIEMNVGAYRTTLQTNFLKVKVKFEGASSSKSGAGFKRKSFTRHDFMWILLRWYRSCNTEKEISSLTYLQHIWMNTRTAVCCSINTMIAPTLSELPSNTPLNLN